MKRKLTALAAVLCVCLSLAACRSGQTTPSTGEPEPTETQAATAATQAPESTQAPPEVPESTGQTVDPQVPQQTAPGKPDADASLPPGEDPVDQLDQVSDY